MFFWSKEMILCLSFQTCLKMCVSRRVWRGFCMVVLFLSLSSSFCEHRSREICLYTWLEVGVEAAWFQRTNHFCEVWFFSLAHITAFAGNPGFWLKAVEELSRISVMFKCFCILLLILTWQRCCFHLLWGWGGLGWHNIGLEFQQRLNCKNMVDS